MLGTAVARGGHRTASVASLAAKETVIQKELAHLRLQADDLQLEHDIAFIVRELLECPSKVKMCKDMVQGDYFLSHLTTNCFHRQPVHQTPMNPTG